MKDAVLFSYDTIDIEKTTDILVEFSCITDFEDDQKLTLNMPDFCTEILGITSTEKHNLFSRIATEPTKVALSLCEDKENAVIERDFWKNIFFFRWKRLHNLLNAFHKIDNAGNTNSSHKTSYNNKLLLSRRDVVESIQMVTHEPAFGSLFVANGAV